MITHSFTLSLLLIFTSNTKNYKSSVCWNILLGLLVDFPFVSDFLFLLTIKILFLAPCNYVISIPIKIMFLAL